MNAVALYPDGSDSRIARRGRALRRRSGFTLIEALATLVLVAIVLPIAMKGISLAAGAASVARSTAEAASLADSKLNELVASGEWTMANISGDFGTDWPGYRWASQTTTRGDGLTELAVQVTFMARGTERSVAVTTLVYASGEVLQ